MGANNVSDGLYGEFKPIATAPADGSKLLLLCDDDALVVGYYCSGRSVWVEPECGHDLLYSKPIGWMPLPSRDQVVDVEAVRPIGSGSMLVRGFNTRWTDWMVSVLLLSSMLFVLV